MSMFLDSEDPIMLIDGDAATKSDNVAKVEGVDKKEAKSSILTDIIAGILAILAVPFGILTVFAGMFAVILPPFLILSAIVFGSIFLISNATATDHLVTIPVQPSVLTGLSGGMHTSPTTYYSIEAEVDGKAGNITTSNPSVATQLAAQAKTAPAIMHLRGHKMWDGSLSIDAVKQ
ncbi:MAG: hypothetical protein ACRCXZ_06305 [Patescibacteria group bacterium]